MKEKITFGEWNIGFTGAADELIDRGGALKISWLRHNYKNCCFADPFIYKVTDTSVELFAEQIFFMKKNARLVRIVVDRKSNTLCGLYPLLALSTHLSYPFIVRTGECTYVIPENTESGKLSLYRYDEETERLLFDRVVIETPLADATIVWENGAFFLFATKKGTDNSDLYVWKSPDVFRGYLPAEGILLKSDFRGSRMAGAFFRYGGDLFRAAQDCRGGYGKGVIVYRVDDLSLQNYRETEVCGVYPADDYYSGGIHTINFHDGVGVVDGYKLRCNPFMRLMKKFNK